METKILIRFRIVVWKLILFYLIQDPDRACYGPKHVEVANERMAVQILLITDELFRFSNGKLIPNLNTDFCIFSPTNMTKYVNFGPGILTLKQGRSMWTWWSRWKIQAERLLYFRPCMFQGNVSVAAFLLSFGFLSVATFLSQTLAKLLLINLQNWHNSLESQLFSGSLYQTSKTSRCKNIFFFYSKKTIREIL